MTWHERVWTAVITLGIGLLMLAALIGVSFLVLSVAGCRPVPSPAPPPTPPTTRIVALTVSPHQVHGVLVADDGQRFEADATDGRLVFTIPGRLTGGADLEITAAGYRPVRQHVALNPELVQPPIALQPLVQRVHAENGRLVQADGTLFLWRGVTAFALLEQIAHGRETEAVAFLDWAAAHDVTVVRVLAMAWNLFRLDPREGAAALPALLALAEARGLHVEVVALADTAFYTFDRANHVRVLGATCAGSASCVFELANEPVHPSQAAQVGDPAYLRDLALQVPPGILRALGPAGATIAEADDRFVAGSDYLPIHEERFDDGSGVRWVRHLNDLREIGARVGLPVVNDEPRRDDLSPDNQVGVGALARVFGLGDTFHSQSGLGAQIPSGAERAAFEARRAGWQVIPEDWTGGTYCNVGFAGCPVLRADWSTVAKVYAAIQGGRGYVVAVGARVAPAVTWGNGWTPTLLAANGRSWVWEVRR